MSAAHSRLFDLGFRNAILWVLEGNVGAERFCVMDHWTPDVVRRTDEVWGVKVNEVRNNLPLWEGQFTQSLFSPAVKRRISSLDARDAVDRDNHRHHFAIGGLP